MPLLKIPHTWIIEDGEIKLVLTSNLHGIEDATYANVGEKQSPILPNSEPYNS